MVIGFHTVEDNVVLGQPVPVFLLGALRICRRSSFRLCDQESGQPVPFYCKALALQSAKHAHMPMVCCIPAPTWFHDPFASQAKQLHTVADHLHKRINAQDKMIQVHAFVADPLCCCLHAWCSLLTCFSDSV